MICSAMHRTYFVALLTGEFLYTQTDTSNQQAARDDCDTFGKEAVARFGKNECNHDQSCRNGACNNEVYDKSQMTNPPHRRPKFAVPLQRVIFGIRERRGFKAHKNHKTVLHETK